MGWGLGTVAEWVNSSEGICSQPYGYSLQETGNKFWWCQAYCGTPQDNQNCFSLTALLKQMGNTFWSYQTPQDNWKCLFSAVLCLQSTRNRRKACCREHLVTMFPIEFYPKGDCLKLRIPICGAAMANSEQFRMQKMTCVNPYLQRVFSFSAFFVLMLEKKNYGTESIKTGSGCFHTWATTDCYTSPMGEKN